MSENHVASRLTWTIQEANLASKPSSREEMDWPGPPREDWSCTSAVCLGQGVRGLCRTDAELWCRRLKKLAAEKRWIWIIYIYIYTRYDLSRGLENWNSNSTRAGQKQDGESNNAVTHKNDRWKTLVLPLKNNGKQHFFMAWARCANQGECPSVYNCKSIS